MSCTHAGVRASRDGARCTMRKKRERRLRVGLLRHAAWVTFRRTHGIPTEDAPPFRPYPELTGVDPRPPVSSVEVRSEEPPQEERRAND